MLFLGSLYMSTEMRLNLSWYLSKNITLPNYRILYSSKSVMLKPVTLGCGQSGCLHCLTSLLRYHQQKGNTKAPCHMSRAAFENTALCVNVALDSITSELEVRCTNNGCQWSGKFSSVERHDQECPHLVVNFPSHRCDKMMKCEEVVRTWGHAESLPLNAGTVKKI